MTKTFTSDIPVKLPPLRVKHRDANDGLQAEISDETSLSNFEPTLTQQHDREDCDINNIIEKWTQTGIPPHTQNAPQFGDFTQVADFHDSLNKVIQAQEMFDALPAQLRARFGNDPAAYLNFALDPENKDEAIRLGILAAPETGPTDAKASSSSSDAPRNTNGAVGASDDTPPAGGEKSASKKP